MAKAKKVSASGIITSAPAKLKAWVISTDGTNDVTAISLYNGTDNTGSEVIPTYDVLAAAKGISGATGIDVDCPDGIYIEFTTAGTAEAVVYFEDIG